MRYSASDFHVVNVWDAISRNPKMYIDQNADFNNLGLYFLQKLIFNAYSAGAAKVKTIIKNDWYYIQADVDWVKDTDIFLSLRDRINPELVIAALSDNVSTGTYTIYEDKIIKGAKPGYVYSYLTRSCKRWVMFSKILLRSESLKDP